MKPMDICNICGSGEVSYYCEECKALFCTGCTRKKKKKINLCVNCGSSGDSLKTQGSTIVCNQCNSTDIKFAIKYIALCPDCSSERVIRIKKKSKDLLIEFKKGVSSLIAGYCTLKQFLVELDAVRQKIISMRYFGFRQYPKLEKTLITVYSEVHLLGENLVTEVFKILQGLDPKLLGVIKKRPWDPRDFSSLESLIKQLKKGGRKCQKSLIKQLTNLKYSVGELLPLIRSLEYFRQVYDGIREHLLLGKYERIICAFSGVSLSSDSIEQNDGNGTLVLTNRRVLFHKRSKEKGVPELIEEKLTDLHSFHVNEADGRIVLKKMNSKIEFFGSPEVSDTFKRFLRIADRFDMNSEDLDRLNRLINIRWISKELYRLNEKMQADILCVLGEKPRFLDSTIAAVSGFEEYSNDVGKSVLKERNMTCGIRHESAKSDFESAKDSKTYEGIKPTGIFRRIRSLFKTGKNRALSDLVLEIGKKNKMNTGGMVPLAEVFMSIRELRPDWNIDVDEVEKAVETLKEKGLIADFREHRSGIKVVEFFPLEFTGDENTVINLAAERGHITLEDVIRNTGWFQIRAVRALKGLEKGGIAKLDPSYSRGKRWYFPYQK